MKKIIIRGARENNLKNIDLDIPRGQITCLIGVSGSGKSSIAFDVLHSEGQRQFLSSISSFAAKFLKKSSEPDVDKVRNLSPTVLINQRKLRGSQRSTVGTATEIYTSLRLLFSRFGSVKNLNAGHFSFNTPKGACEKCRGVGKEFVVDLTKLIDLDKSLNEGAVNHNNYKPGARLFNILKISGKIDIDKKIGDFSEKEFNFLVWTPRVEMSNESNGFIQRFSHEGIAVRLMKRAGDLRGISDRKKSTDFRYLNREKCSGCSGSRLRARALESTVNGENIGHFSNLELSKLQMELEDINIPEAESLLQRINEGIQNLLDVNLGYLSLNRGLDTLSGGESQRLKLAREMGSSLIELTYVLDEPTSGLHPRDRENILKIVKKIKESGNTVIMIEHDREMMKGSDVLIEIGPGAGMNGGKIVFQGSFDELLRDPKSVTGQFLQKKGGKNPESLQKIDRRVPTGFLKIENANENNLKNVSCKIPLGVLCAFTGVSGSGKSSLLIDNFSKMLGKDAVVINQTPMQGTARGNATTYIGIFDQIRNLVGKNSGVSKRFFSFNGEGACKACKGLGYKKIDMHFLGDVKTLCEICNGNRFSPEILEYRYFGKNIAEILRMTAREALEFFDDKKIRNGLQSLVDVGLDYIEIGQSHDTLSGGESQRLKLAKHLQRRGEIYILDEPTSGLHFLDVQKLLKTLKSLVENGNTVLVIEHNLELIKSADYIIDLGPDGGERGGEIVAVGTPEEIIKVRESWTGRCVKKYLERA